MLVITSDRHRRGARSRWRSLCERYLPLDKGGSIWRFSRARRPDDPTQGWKLHVSATLLNAASILELIAPPLTARSVRFKAPASLQALALLNSGLTYGYSQVGKVFTIYPRDDKEAARLARLLHKLTSGVTAPVIPFDRQFRPGSNVFYRYGAMDSFEMDLPDGRRVSAIRDPDGNPVPGARESAKARPDWVEELFPARKLRGRKCAAADRSPLTTTFRVFRALTQGGKGGVAHV
jgi:hypothetical protein